METINKEISQKIMELYCDFKTSYYVKNKEGDFAIAKSYTKEEEEDKLDKILSLFQIMEFMKNRNMEMRLDISLDTTKFLSIEVVDDKDLVESILRILTEKFQLRQQNILVRKYENKYFVDLFFSFHLSNLISQKLYLFIKDELKLTNYEISYHPKSVRGFDLHFNKLEHEIFDAEMKSVDINYLLAIKKIDINSEDFKLIEHAMLSNIDETRLKKSGYLDEEFVKWPSEIRKIEEQRVFDLSLEHWNYAVYYHIGIRNEEFSRKQIEEIWKEIIQNTSIKYGGQIDTDKLKRAVEKSLDQNYEDKGYIKETPLFLTKKEALFIFKSQDNKRKRETLFALYMYCRMYNKPTKFQFSSKFLSKKFGLGKREAIVNRIEQMTDENGEIMVGVERVGASQWKGEEVKKMNTYSLNFEMNLDIDVAKKEKYIVITDFDSRNFYRVVTELIDEDELNQIVSKSDYQNYFKKLYKEKEEVVVG
ncbi:hypothetical protein ACWN8B_00200 [Vagococcus zengguangii]|uniref:Uncharacterized protein n=1 Tax=Vagococcus zengguangii TaxID=2571750 RepID=A0A4D7CVM1_9ENTE|nr:hypothetical protein [Vagococcus zengguangii]QCI86337.1 hypothetical protein FA707_04875 [Vagococcus zengguangii]